MLVFDRLPGRVTSVAFSPDGSRLAAGVRGGFVPVWDALTGAQVGAVTLPPHGVSAGLVAVAFAAAGPDLVVADAAEGVAVWTPGGAPVRDLLPRRPFGHECRGLAVTSDGRVLTTSRFELALVDPAGGAVVWTRGLAGWRDRVVAAEPGGVRAAHGSGELFDVATGTPLGRWRPEPSDPATGLAWSPARPAVAAADGKAAFAVFDPDTGEQLARLRPTNRHTNAVAFTPDGRRLLAAGTDGFVRVYDGADWTRPPAVFDWDRGPVYALAVSPDGTRAAAGTGTTHRGVDAIWDLD